MMNAINNRLMKGWSVTLDCYPDESLLRVRADGSTIMFVPLTNKELRFAKQGTLSLWKVAIRQMQRRTTMDDQLSQFPKLVR